MIPKSVVELTISIFKNDLEELEEFNKKMDNKVEDGYGESKFSSSVKHNIDVYKMLIKEYEKYLDESYREIKEPPPKPVPPKNIKVKEPFLRSEKHKIDRSEKYYVTCKDCGTDYFPQIQVCPNCYCPIVES